MSAAVAKGVTPFASAEEAWFWTMEMLAARKEQRAPRDSTPRPCEPDDIPKTLDTLYRRNRIDLIHARILRIWGERQRAPSPTYPPERNDLRLWREALDRLDWPLRIKGIVA